MNAACIVALITTGLFFLWMIASIGSALRSWWRGDPPGTWARGVSNREDDE